eukprot:CAMPEP_0206061588 /NCGR_PEP_ID=MMETSP1466-20131121/54472_1 /ASSEMBLY_ACC=CAM_ASM_001126 /TAXON_ID=44452 /ORGANISM="Pavlova gyrans, Strain CCMP608" /LENGTH=44 /DNA_ID= /DNA_START= /DNA_END= /DNA_ORIENTATION=
MHEVLVMNEGCSPFECVLRACSGARSVLASWHSRAWTMPLRCMS